jgi:pilus assembly protein CpaF
VVQISELTRMEEDVITMQDIFRFMRTGIDAQGRVTGRFAPSGIRPRIFERLDELGQAMPVEIQQLFPEPPLRTVQQ